MNSSKYKASLYEHRPITDLKDMVDSSAVLFADKPAYLVKDRPGGAYRPITFAQAKKDIDALGTALMDLKLTGKKIAVIGENRYEWVVTYLATVNGTGVIVPLDKELTAVEINGLLERAEVSAVVYSGKVERKIREAMEGIAGIEVAVSMDARTDSEEALSFRQLIEKGNRLLAEEKRWFVDAKIDPEELRMLLFTSGTTGKAKAVMLCQRNITSNVYNMSKYVNVTGDQVGLSILPMHHTYEFTCLIMTAFYQGCGVAICEGLKYIVKNMAECKATVMLGVPLIFESMHKKVWKKAEASGKAKKMRAAITMAKTLNKMNIKSTKRLFKDVHQAMGGNMRLLISGAAAIDPAVVSDFNAMGITMIQGYGMTENSPIIAVNMDRYHKDAAAGLPMPGTEIKLVDVDENGVGEIICKGDSVMMGYYKDPEETAKVLVDGWLYTGDYGYFDKEGFLYISGRKKNVIVTKNGKNIFPEEVETHLNKSDFIKEVVVVGIEDEKSGETVVKAIIVPEYSEIEAARGKLSDEALRSLLKEIVEEANDKMSSYKRVKRIEIRNTEFEKTTTNKIKR